MDFNALIILQIAPIQEKNKENELPEITKLFFLVYLRPVSYRPELKKLRRNCGIGRYEQSNAGE
jgi:hypothetical protein